MYFWVLMIFKKFLKKRKKKTNDIFIGWRSFMDSEYLLGREEVTWNYAQVSMNTTSLD